MNTTTNPKKHTFTRRAPAAILLAIAAIVASAAPSSAFVLDPWRPGPATVKVAKCWTYTTTSTYKGQPLTVTACHSRRHSLR